MQISANFDKNWRCWYVWCQISQNVNVVCFFIRDPTDISNLKLILTSSKKPLFPFIKIFQISRTSIFLPRPPPLPPLLGYLFCLPHDLLIAKPETYSFDTKTLFKSYLNQRKKFENINKILKGYPRNSFKSTIMIDLRANTFQHFYKWSPAHQSTNTHNYADGNTLATHGDWYCDWSYKISRKCRRRGAFMVCTITNADKFRAILARKDKKAQQKFHSW